MMQYNATLNMQCLICIKKHNDATLNMYNTYNAMLNMYNNTYNIMTQC